MAQVKGIDEEALALELVENTKRLFRLYCSIAMPNYKSIAYTISQVVT